MQNKQIDSINNMAAQESKEETIASGLSEIYHDETGKLIDVKKLIIRKKRSWIVWVTNAVIGLACLAAVAWGLKHFMSQGISSEALEFSVLADKQPVAGEEFYVMVNFKNSNPVNLDNVELHLTYPEGFVFVDSSPVADVANNTWRIGALPMGAFSQIKIKGKLIIPLNQKQMIIGELRYRTEGFSSEFKKVANLELSVTDIGLDFSIIRPDTVLVGEKQKMVIKYRGRQKYLDNFRLQVEPSNPGNVEFITDVQKSSGIELVKPWVWQVSDLSEQDKEIVIYYKVLDKIGDKQHFDLDFKYRLATPISDSVSKISTSTGQIAELDELLGQLSTSSTSVEISKPVESFYSLAHEAFDQELIKNDLNLLMIINGSDKDQGVDFGQTLHYALSYNNKGEANLENVVITAVLETDLIDWASFKDKNHGLVKNNTITWTKDQISDLGRIGKGANGTIDFTVKLKEPGSNFKTDQIKSYAQFQVQSAGDLEALLKLIKERDTKATEADQPNSNQSESKKDADSALIGLLENKSNVIVNKVNSDFQIEQTLRYFNEDNIPVGAGPLPLEVAKDTSLRVYWKLKNSFHDLDTVKVSVKLPDYVTWQEKSQLSAGTIRWDETSRQVIWELQNLPKTAGEATAEFSINIKPKPEQKNQIIIILPMADANANDISTKGSVHRTSKVKTSKLEDDDIVRTVNLDAASGLIK